MTMPITRPDATAASRPRGVSVLIMTLNEEVNLPACLASVAWSDDIVVLDSFSTDRTVEIARAAGARVYERAYDDEASQRNYGIKRIEFKYPWVYLPDADEIATDELRDELLAIAADPSRPEAYFRARFKNIFMGRWIRHSSLYPTWNIRFVRPDRCRFERTVHSHVVADGPCGHLRAHYLHYSFNKGLDAWYEKHNRYSAAEARLALTGAESGRIEWRKLFAHGPEQRRRVLKLISFRLPFRPLLRFLYMYVLRRGFLDGTRGYTYCRMLAVYELMIVTKIAELRRRRHGLPI